MLTGFYQSLLILLVVFAFYVPDTYFHRRYPIRHPASRSGRSPVVNVMFGAISVFLVTQPILLPRFNFHFEYGWLLQLTGGLLLVGSSGLNVWARSHLGRFYSQRSEIQENHRLVNTGPYRYVRHPLFVAYFFFVLSMFCFDPGLTTAALLIFTSIYLSVLTQKDEQVLVTRLPGYAGYMLYTPRYIPNRNGKR